MNELMIALAVLLGISLVMNVIQSALMRDMVTKDIFALLAGNIPPELVQENTEIIREYLLNDSKKWNDVLAYVLGAGSNTLVNELEELQNTPE